MPIRITDSLFKEYRDNRNIQNSEISSIRREKRKEIEDLDKNLTQANKTAKIKEIEYKYEPRTDVWRKNVTTTNADLYNRIIDELTPQEMLEIFKTRFKEDIKIDVRDEVFLSRDEISDLNDVINDFKEKDESEFQTQFINLSKSIRLLNHSMLSDTITNSIPKIPKSAANKLVSIIYGIKKITNIEFREDILNPTIKAFENNPKISSNLVILVAIGAIAGILYGDYSINKLATSIPSISTTNQPINTTIPPISQDLLDIYLLECLRAHYMSKNGCFMIKGNTPYQLSGGCSDWYGESVENEFNCSCGKSESKPLEATAEDCSKDEESLKPYCIGKFNDTNSMRSCQNVEVPILYKCTDVEMGNSNFVYYHYVNEPIISIIEDIVDTLPVKKSNPIITLVIGIIIIGSILLIVYLMNKNK